MFVYSLCFLCGRIVCDTTGYAKYRRGRAANSGYYKAARETFELPGKVTVNWKWDPCRYHGEEEYLSLMKLFV